MAFEDILARSLIALALAVAGVIGFRIWRSAQLRRVSEISPRTPGLTAWQPGRRAILYFTTPDCAPCRTTQVFSTRTSASSRTSVARMPSFSSSDDSRCESASFIWQPNVAT